MNLRNTLKTLAASLGLLLSVTALAAPDPGYPLLVNPSMTLLGNFTNLFKQNSNLLNAAVAATGSTSGMATTGYVNAAIAAVPSATNSITTNTAQLLALGSGLFGGQRLTRVLFVGDSMSDSGWSYYSAALATAGKLKAMYGDGGNALGNLSGGNNGSYYYPEASYWPAVRAASVRTGESVTAQQDASYVLNGGYPITFLGDAKVAGAFYLKWPKGGTLAITNSHLTSGLAAVGTTVSTYSAGTNVGYTSFNVTSNDNRLTMTGVSGSNVVLGVRFAPTNGPGVESYWFSLSGVTMTTQVDVGVNALTDLRAAIAPDVIFYHAKDSDVPIPTFYSKITTLISSLATASTKVYLIGTPDTGVGSDTNWNAALETAASSNNWGYIDLRAAFPNLAQMREAGYVEPDNGSSLRSIHPYTNGAIAWADVIIRGMTTAQKSSAGGSLAAVPDPLAVAQLQATSGEGADYDPAMVLGADVNGSSVTAGTEKAGYLTGLRLNNSRFCMARYYVDGSGNIFMTIGSEGSSYSSGSYSRGPDYLSLGVSNYLAWTIEKDGNLLPGAGYVGGYLSATNNGIGSAIYPINHLYTDTLYVNGVAITGSGGGTNTFDPSAVTNRIKGQTFSGQSGSGTDYDPALVIGADVNTQTLVAGAAKAGYVAGYQTNNAKWAMLRYYSDPYGSINFTIGGEGSTTPGFSLGPDRTSFGIKDYLAWTVNTNGDLLPGNGGVSGYKNSTNNGIGSAALPVNHVYAKAFSGAALNYATPTNAMASLVVDMSRGSATTNLAGNATIAGVAWVTATNFESTILRLRPNGAPRTITLPTSIITPDGTRTLTVTNSVWGETILTIGGTQGDRTNATWQYYY